MSQGHLRCCGIFSDSIITNVLLILQWNTFGSRSIFEAVKVYKTKCASFLGHPVDIAQRYRRCIWLDSGT